MPFHRSFITEPGSLTSLCIADCVTRGFRRQSKAGCGGRAVCVGSTNETVWVRLDPERPHPRTNWSESAANQQAGRGSKGWEQGGTPAWKRNHPKQCGRCPRRPHSSGKHCFCSGRLMQMYRLPVSAAHLPPRLYCGLHAGQGPRHPTVPSTSEPLNLLFTLHKGSFLFAELPAAQPPISGHLSIISSSSSSFISRLTCRSRHTHTSLLLCPKHRPKKLRGSFPQESPPDRPPGQGQVPCHESHGTVDFSIAPQMYFSTLLAL